VSVDGRSPIVRAGQMTLKGDFRRYFAPIFIVRTTLVATVVRLIISRQKVISERHRITDFRCSHRRSSAFGRVNVLRIKPIQLQLSRQSNNGSASHSGIVDQLIYLERAVSYHGSLHNLNFIWFVVSVYSLYPL